MSPQDTILPGAVLADEMPADKDEPPESAFWAPKLNSAYSKALPPAYMRRESLLTRQLHSEDEEHISPTRGLSTVSTWSNPSVASTAELTSDDGRSMPSPAISPPLPPTSLRTVLPVEKVLDTEPKIVGLDTVSKDPVEAGLGRRRCITFACGNKEKKVEEPVKASPPKRKCALKFICPTKISQDATSPKTPVKRFGSPSPKHRRSSSSSKSKRLSTDGTPTSPRPSRKSLAGLDSAAKSASPVRPKSTLTQLLDNSDDSGAEATKFHEFASSEDEPDEWTQESTCYRSRLCVADTLKKESVIRKLGEEVEAEDQEEDEDDEDEDQDDEDAIEDGDDDEDEIEEESDDGFRSDDEEGFAVSDSEDEEGSDNEWWTPGRLSTAATSAEHLDQLNKLAQPEHDVYASSLASMSSANADRRPHPFRTHSKSSALAIDRPSTPDLPDSTDFVCGTLDEDRPQEQAYINLIKQREAAKHKPVPQDIDPTFPTSDPEMDEEDDEDLADAVSSDNEAMMHGSLDSIHGTARRISPTPRRSSVRQRSLPRHKSPAPRAKSPAPIRHKSPAPRAKSPAPKIRVARRSSPAPRARSPAPRKLFGHSPMRRKSPAPAARMTSPPNTRRASPSNFMTASHGLAQRPNTLAVAASLPKRPGGFLLSRLGTNSDIESSDTVAPHQRGGRRRGAIDIVKGLEKKKQRRKEKLAQKLAAKAAARGEDRKKVKPGRGCERMREVGLELQKYKGGAGHILSY